MKRGKPLTRKTPLASGTTPLARKTPLARARTPRQRRLRRDEMDPEIRAAVIARAAGRCEHCGKRTPADQLHAHHRKLRTRGGPDSMANLLAVAFDCHGWIHEHPGASGDAGWMLHAWEDPATTEVLYYGRIRRCLI